MFVLSVHVNLCWSLTLHWHDAPPLSSLTWPEMWLNNLQRLFTNPINLVSQWRWCGIRSSEPYDPYLPRGGSSAAPNRAAGTSQTAEIQRHIDETVGVMRDNIQKVAERGERLDALQDKTGTFCCIFPQLLEIRACVLCSMIRLVSFGVWY